MKTALITHADCLDHVTPAGHPEQVARLEHVLHALAPLDLNRITAPLAADDDLLRIHPKPYIDEIKQMRPESGTFQVDADTHMSPGSVDAAYRAAGGTLRAVDFARCDFWCTLRVHHVIRRSGCSIAIGRCAATYHSAPDVLGHS